MLHKINVACEVEFNWIIKLQRDLLYGVCRPEINAETVTIKWIKALRPDIDTAWMGKFCERKDKLSSINLPLIQHLKTIAGCSPTLKTKIMANFENNHGFKTAFDPDRKVPYPLKPINDLPDIGLVKALRGFFTGFYDPNFYQQCGFPVPSGGKLIKFTRECFLNGFGEKNRDVGVCVLCDGDLGDPDIDHFYSKKAYPELSCHPANLVPICRTCNGRARKGEKPPLDKNAADPMLNWFHPYFRSAEGLFCVDFKEEENKIYPVLKGSNQNDQKRLDNLNDLVGLSSQWRRKLNQLVQSTAIKYRDAKLEELQAKLLEDADNMVFEMKHISGAILREAFSRKVAEGYKPLLDELRVEIGNLDPVTATESYNNHVL